MIRYIVTAAPWSLAGRQGSALHVVKVAPSIIAAKAERLADEVRAVAQAGADWIHMDVMDGAFVPNITFGPWLHAGVRAVTDLPLDTHLMVDEPLRFLDDYRRAGADWITVHVEACRHLHRTLAAVRASGAQVGVSVNPATPLESVRPVIDMVDLVLVMSVSPGFAGQAFIPGAIGRVAMLSDWRRSGGYPFLISVDGGVSGKNAAALRQAGADVLVAGSAVYGAADYAQAIAALRA